MEQQIPRINRAANKHSNLRRYRSCPVSCYAIRCRPSDFVMEQHGVKIVIDDVSMGYMQGATVDYVDDIMGSGFKIENPNATSTCGCGHSFRTDGQDAPSGGGSCR